MNEIVALECAFVLKKTVVSLAIILLILIMISGQINHDHDIQWTAYQLSCPVVKWARPHSVLVHVLSVLQVLI